MAYQIHDHTEPFTLTTETVETNERRKANRSKYKNVVCAFDIETTRIPEIEQTVMYIWQFQIDTDCTVYGRTWDQFKCFCDRVLEYIAEGSTLCIYVHNLSYEFQFLRGVFDFAEDDVF